jgi:hypothetical protein
MNEPFLLPVPYKGVSYEFPARLVMLGYIYQFHIEMEGRVLIFERDEERNYRVIDNMSDTKPLDIHLLETVIQILVALQDD